MTPHALRRLLPLLALALPCAANAQLPQDSAEERFEWYGEELYYSIEMLGSEAARCAIAVGYPTDHDEHGLVVPLEGLALSVGFFANVYPMEDTAVTYVGTDGLPVQSTKVIDERNRERSYAVAYEQETFTSAILRTEGEHTRRTGRFVPSDTHDAISWMLDLRSRDLGIGNEYVYHIFDGWKLSRLTARITDHTEVYTELGIMEVAEMTFTREVLASHHPLPYADDSTLLPPVYVVNEGPAELGIGWFSLDDRRIPVGVDIETPIGHLRMIIDRHVVPDQG
jgi:hypothetical protein